MGLRGNWPLMHFLGQVRRSSGVAEPVAEGMPLLADSWIGQSVFLAHCVYTWVDFCFRRRMPRLSRMSGQTCADTDCRRFGSRLPRSSLSCGIPLSPSQIPRQSPYRPAERQPRKTLAVSIGAAANHIEVSLVGADLAHVPPGILQVGRFCAGGNCRAIHRGNVVFALLRFRLMVRDLAATVHSLKYLSG